MVGLCVAVGLGWGRECLQLVVGWLVSACHGHWVWPVVAGSGGGGVAVYIPGAVAWFCCISGGFVDGLWAWCM